MDVLIVGAGSMGSWFASAVDADVTFADVDPDAAAAAAEAVGGEVGDLEGDDRYDAVCVAVPMTHVGDAVASHAGRADRAIVDVSGVMGEPLEAMKAHATGLERVSLHPLFAPERAPGSIAVARDRSGPVTDRLLADLDSRGNDLVETTASEHDEAMETVQAATHAAVLSFALVAESVPQGFETPIYEQLRTLAEQLTEGTPRVYADIQGTFDGADAVARAATEVAAADSDELEELYRRAAKRWQSEPIGADRQGGLDGTDAANDSDADAGERR
ncbi:prephenate dehydrogenase/arogenate dehydrogenase family protein [Natrarchaeobius oligotrophus]|uniref:Prephenate dehydrogenase n=1 Tax=Natrarchaeobius chitinivorans TaxID=1679083 RepID=A0A3N6MTZ2_NATCH|nr:prephenate dehydrogenase/arogenate dehydrogenase family protein [Natrarchaeobius chitinivorans]RQG99751.1 prephenate dehydrogenase [Natrarchaeobius chitinivorans]